jgi:pSer/pThr/pTyr-binding forkhead associated (FHA) protein
MFSSWFGSTRTLSDAAPRLISLETGGSHSDIPLEDLPLLIGRSAVADVQLRDICVNDFHCVLEGCPEQLKVRDLGSRQGTFINGVRVAHATLLPGDTLTLGESHFQLSGPEDSASAH